MLFFKKSWESLHEKFCETYEDIALNSLADKTEWTPVDFKSVTKDTVRVIDPKLTAQNAAEFVDAAYISFRNFDVYSDLSTECRRQNPEISDAALNDIYTELKQLYLKKMDEHYAFLLFVVSLFIASSDYNITRGGYLFQVALGHAPRPGIWRTAKMIAKFKNVKENRSN